jgi:hypothetical protein
MSGSTPTSGFRDRSRPTLYIEPGGRAIASCDWNGELAKTSIGIRMQHERYAVELANRWNRGDHEEVLLRILALHSG